VSGELPDHSKFKTVFNKSTRKSWTPDLLTNSCSHLRTRTGPSVPIRQTGHINFKLALFGVSEVRWNGAGSITTTNCNLFIYSGVPGENEPHVRGWGYL
jgi:hypothetical protein